MPESAAQFVWPAHQQFTRELGRRARCAREQAGLSPQEVAERMGAHDPHFVVEIECGNSHCSAWTVFRLARVLKISVDQLMPEEMSS